ncbi:MAG: hypothetical protein M3188_07415 [Actinomycetota bacterium]|nr:hypothetical protein [Actinomycetota bacterium]
MPDERTRVEIGLEGGQTIGAVASSSVIDALFEMLGRNPDGVFELVAEEGTYMLPLRAVMYVKRFSRESQIGFGRAE